MDGILEWGVDVIQAIQTVASPGLTVAMKLITQAGSEYFYLLLLPVVFWCVDERFGTRLGIVLLGSVFVNGWLKQVFAQPRPFDLDPSVGLSHESSYGLPSGHAQGTSTLWGLLAAKIRKPWGLTLAIVIPLLVSFTRLYLGVHFPTDVALGLALGWSLAVAGTLLGDRVAAVLRSWHIRWRIVAAAVAALAMNALNPADSSIPGVFFGTAVGAAFLFETLRFDASSGSLAQKAARLGLGLVGVVVLYAGIKLVVPAEGEPQYALFRFVRYGLVGAWVSYGAPWVFIKMGFATGRPIATASVEG
ncbi:MAG: phosphatase PAP2 family protein [Spirochaetales bacterium]|nr:phosphatase PAP2 family protein [Spirochaetales bacterium]